MFQKNLWEKLGELLAHPGKRFLLGILSILFLGPFGVMIALSVAEKQKDYFVKNVYVHMPSGEGIPCAILKKNHYCFLPVFPFFSPFFYFPYKTDYYLVKDMATPGFQENTQVYGTVLDIGLIRAEQIPVSKLKAILQNPQILSYELDGQAQLAREQFLRDAQPFFETGLLQELFELHRISVCKLVDRIVLFHYGKQGCQRGIFLKEQYVEKAVENATFLLGHYLTMDSEQIANGLVELNDKLLERLLRECAQQGTYAANTQMERLNRQKKVFTRQMVEKTIQTRTASSKKALGWIICFLALGAVELGIFGFVGGVFVLGILFLPLGIWLFYKGIKMIRTGAKNRDRIQQGRYRIVKTVCTGATEQVQETDDGTIYSYTMTFSNGESDTRNMCMGVVGDPFYLIYLEGEKKPCAFFNGIEYVPAPDLYVEQYM